MRRYLTIFLLLLALGTSSLGACGSETKAWTPPKKDHATFDVTWAPNTKVIEEADGKTHLTGALPNGGTLIYTFDAGATAIAALQPGDIAVLAGIAYRKVVAVRSTGTGIELETVRTTLPEAMTSGTLDWARTVDFSDLAALEDATMFLGDRRVPVADMVLGTPITYEGEISGYMVSLTLTPSQGRLEVNAVVTLMVPAGGGQFGIMGTGHIESFQGSGHAVVGAGRLLEFQAGQNHVRGELQVTAAATNTGLNDTLLDVPMGIDIPIQAGPVPLILKVKGNINVRLILGLADSSANAEVTFRFSSNQGISVSGVSLASTGALESGDPSDFGGGAADPITAGMSACLEFPRFELTMLGEFASVGFTQNNCAETFFQFQPACNEVNGYITGIALASLGFFGVTLAEGQVQMYRRQGGMMLGMCN